MSKSNTVEYPNSIPVQCVFEPRGENGLEGFQRGEIYWAQQANMGRGVFWRVWPSNNMPSPLNEPTGVENYYEVCGPIVFNRYFAITEEAHAITKAKEGKRRPSLPSIGKIFPPLKTGPC